MSNEICNHRAILKKGILLEGCLVAHLNGEGPCIKCPSCGKWVDGKTRRKIEKEIIMDIKDLLDEKRKLNIKLFQAIKEFEDKAEVVVNGITIIHNVSGLESATVRIEIPE